MNRVHQLHQLGQSVWYDNIQRSLIENGLLADMIEQGVIRGVTSNPSIFHNAIAKSHDYDAALKTMAWSGWSALQIFHQLAIEDIQAAADLFLPLYKQTQCGDGYVSLEVNPLLAHDTLGTVAEAKRLWQLVKRPNLMIKIPATPEGIPAIRECLSAGINVNVTLIFSLVRYKQVMDAFLSGLEDRVKAGLPIDRIASVASFFVSRVDTKIDRILDDLLQKEDSSAHLARTLFGKAAIANARMAYTLYLETFASLRFDVLRQKGARTQRPLWASTSTKNPAYRDVVYVEELIGADTVNTMPPQTLEAFQEHGESQVSLGWDVSQDQQVIAQLESIGISMQKITAELESEGVKAFADAFEALLKTIEERRKLAVDELGVFKDILPAEVVRAEYDSVIHRLFAIDPTLWSQEPAMQSNIRKRLGWLVSPQTSRSLIATLSTLAAECRAEGMTHALLLGMGGSSLAPEVLRLSFGVGTIGKKKAFDLSILDSTDPEQVRAAANRAPLEKSLFIVSSKSGSTSEVSAFLDFFWSQAKNHLGETAGRHFVAITDPGTKLENLAIEREFRAVLHGDTQVGGRYSALTAFGLFPAALLGINLNKLLERAAWMMNQSLPAIPGGRNPGLVLGILLGTAALDGRDKLTLLVDPPFESFASWLEQLIAESTGKNGRGIIPVELEPPVSPALYGEDRMFVYLRSAGEQDDFVAGLKSAGHPVLVFDLKDAYDLGAEFYRWEIATAIACALLGINAFDQPDVQDNKDRTTRKIASYLKKGDFSEGKILWENEHAKVFGIPLKGIKNAKTLKEVVKLFLMQAQPNDYLAINAYLPREAQTARKLQKIRKAFLERTHCPVTLGFGPRFLHSTGQLHKGGTDRALFLQITRDPIMDLDIPRQGITFGELERAQALGDLEALLNRNRRVIRIHLTGGDVEDLI
ncbi:MAG: bifunctional transaldolase/phosoglucose isomerase [Chloroflexota bacterium]